MAIPLLVVVGVALSIGMFVLLQVQAREAARDRMERAATQYRLAVEERLQDTVFVLTALRGLFAGSVAVTVESFAAAADPLLPLHDSLTAVGWATRLVPGEEEELEREARARGVARFTVAPESGAAASPGGDRFVLLHVQPADSATVLAGLDLVAIPGHGAALARACADDRITGDAPSAGLLRLFMPVYSAPALRPEADARCDAVTGFLMAEIAIDRLAARAFAAVPSPSPPALLVDGSPAGEGRVLAATGSAGREGISEGAAVQSLSAGDIPWQVVVPPNGGVLFPGDPTAWGTLAVGLVLTGLLAAYLHREGRAHRLLQAEAVARSAMARMLRESEERFRLALRHSHVSVFSQDRDLRYAWVYNPQLPIPAERFIGRRHADLFGPAEAERLDALKRRVMESGTGVREEMAFTTGGRLTVLDLVVEPLRDDDGAIAGVICASIDITESTRIKTALAEAHAEAERANRAKSRFLAAASHDLRQPFQAMSLFHHVLSASLTDPRQIEIAGKLGEALAAGNALLTALLDTSALEVGSVTPRTGDFPFRTIADRLAIETAGQAAEKGLEFRMVPSRAMVHSDPVLLERILRNLLVNALRYTRRGRILMGCRHRGDRLVVEVWDTGPGIPQDQLESVFEDFYRGHADRDDDSRGLGLGLSIVRRTARMLEHPVTVRSVVGRGTVFGISVPLARTAGGDDPGGGAGTVARPAALPHFAAARRGGGSPDVNGSDSPHPAPAG
ncbi:ATP-binding protein [Azospirillum halopraeferens]|uniref:sensor histidine kinase n=1 Tax=Azospirillum halopraeferens TaxID=34010 RepID=UPI000685E6CC|nr:ATP-binding protein [Azospirillum halopraeferens]